MFSSVLLLAQQPLTDACGEEPSWLCDLVFRWTESDLAARTADLLLATPLKVAGILVVAFVVYRWARSVIARFVLRMEADIRRRTERGRELGVQAGTAQAQTRRMQRLHAIGGASRSAVGVVIWLVALLLAAAQMVDLGPVLAGAGVAGLIVGFGAQSLIADFLAGVSMLIEDQYGVGDWIEVEGRAGQVEQVGLRTTRFRDLDGVVWHVSNASVKLVGNLSQRWARATLDIPVALDTDVAQARRVIRRVADGLAEDPEWGEDIIAKPEVWGVQDWGPDGMSIRLVVPTRPLRNWDVNRQLRERLKYAFDRAGIRMPAPMREIGGQRTGAPVRLQDDDAPETPARGDYRTHAPDTTGRLATTDPPRPDRP